jgi:hypothetical protein
LCPRISNAVSRMEELSAKADKESDSTNGGRGDALAKPNGNLDLIIEPATSEANRLWLVDLNVVVDCAWGNRILR